MFILSTNEINGIPTAEKNGIIYFYDMEGNRPVIFGVASKESFMLVDDPAFNIGKADLSLLEDELEAQLATKH